MIVYVTNVEFLRTTKPDNHNTLISHTAFPLGINIGSADSVVGDVIASIEGTLEHLAKSQEKYHTLVGFNRVDMDPTDVVTAMLDRTNKPDIHTATVESSSCITKYTFSVHSVESL
jgi:hypothetical protein